MLPGRRAIVERSVARHISTRPSNISHDSEEISSEPQSHLYIADNSAFFASRYAASFRTNIVPWHPL
jgi:hypothetical protein